MVQVNKWFVTKFLPKSLWASKSFENSYQRVEIESNINVTCFFFILFLSLRQYLIVWICVCYKKVTQLDIFLNKLCFSNLFPVLTLFAGIISKLSWSLCLSLYWLAYHDIHCIVFSYFEVGLGLHFFKIIFEEMSDVTNIILCQVLVNDYSL